MTDAELEQWQREADDLIASLDGRLEIHRDDVSEKMEKHSSEYMTIAIAHAKVVKRSKLLLFQLGQIEASVTRRIAGRPTERMVETHCQAHEFWPHLKRKLIELEGIKDALDAVLESLKHRRDMLVNYGATVREEMRSIETHTRRLDDGNRQRRA